MMVFEGVQYGIYWVSKKSVLGEACVLSNRVTRNLTEGDIITDFHILYYFACIMHHNYCFRRKQHFYVVYTTH